jgi:mono/diheme cytochrome c family protein
MSNKLLLLVSSLLTLLLLAGAAGQENFLQEWRQLQRGAPMADGSGVHLRQVVVPALHVTDRCVTCHVGMGPGEQGQPGHPVMKPHPDVAHDPASFGCTTCHGGQGRATEKADAHGAVHFWPEPMIPRANADSGCGTCHTQLRVPNLAQLREGAAVLERSDCLACHRLDGRGGTLRPGAGGGMEGPDLSRVGVRGYQPDWYARHLSKREAGEPAAWRESFGPIPAHEQDALRVLLDSRVGAPRLIEGKALFHSLGCRGCHKVGGVGGDDGPDLTTMGLRDPGRLDFTHVPGERSVSSWLAEHFRAPATIVPGSQMPVLGLSEREIAPLVAYMLSLRRTNVPEAYWPKDRILAERFGEREFATDGATLYGTFCAACHGPEGEGRRYAGMAAFPAIGSTDFLALASDRFIEETVRRGRPGRRMPAWGEKDGGLRPDEVTRVVAYVRGLGRGVVTEADPRPARWVRADGAEGSRLYGAYCGQCHGNKGQGGEGPALNDQVLLAAGSDTYFVETIRRGRAGTSMEGFSRASMVRPSLEASEIEAIVAFLRTWEKKQ